jgi:hypothetical protein
MTNRLPGNALRYVAPHIAARAPGLDVDAPTVVRWAKKGWIFFRQTPAEKKPRYRIAIDAEGWPVFTSKGSAACRG